MQDSEKSPLKFIRIAGSQLRLMGFETALMPLMEIFLGLVVQVFHYFHLYLSLTSREEFWEDSDLPMLPITFSVPTGAAGHVTAGILASLMGLPIDTLIMATNEVSLLASAWWRYLGDGSTTNGRTISSTL